MIHLRVEPIGVVRGYSSAGASILAFHSNPRQPRARKCSEILRGKRLENAAFSLSQCVFHLTESKPLRVFISGNEVDWELPDGLPLTSPTPLKCDVSYDFGLDTPTLTSPSELLRARHNARLKSLSVTEVGLYVYFEGYESLFFGAVRDCKTDERVLFLFEGE